MTVRFYSSTAPEVTLNAGVSNVATVIIVSSTTGFPINTPYTLALDYGSAVEELVEVTSAAGTSLTVTRAIDGTSAASHGAGAKVRHVSSARDFKDSRDHENASTNVHGLTGGAAVVGTTTVQTLSSKTLTSPVLNTPTVNTPTFSGNASGSLGGSIGSTIDLVGTSTTDPVLTIKGNPTNVTNLTEWQNNAGTALAVLSNSGMLSVPTIFVSGTALMEDINVSGSIIGGAVGVSDYAYKSGDTTRTATTVLADPDLTVQITNSNGAFIIEAYLVISGDPNADINMNFTVPTGSSGNWTPLNYNTAATGNNGPVELVATQWSGSRTMGVHPNGTSQYGILIRGLLKLSGAPTNTDTVNWGAATGGGTGTTLAFGSWLKSTRIA